jgi:hypothetical protein
VACRPSLAAAPVRRTALGGAAAHSADVIRSATGAMVSAICSSNI